MPIEGLEVFELIVNLASWLFTSSSEEDKFIENCKSNLNDFTICVEEIEKLNANERADLLKYLKLQVGITPSFDNFITKNFETYQYPITGKLIVETSVVEDIIYFADLVYDNFIESIIINSKHDAPYYIGGFIIEKSVKLFDNSVFISFSNISENDINRLEFILSNGESLYYDFTTPPVYEKIETQYKLRNPYKIKLPNFAILKSTPIKYLINKI
jgi:hypothetical protein